MKVVDIPLVLMGLNTLEQRLISKATVFMKMVIIPRGGQRSVRGQVINFPSNVDSVISESEDKSNGPDKAYHCCRYSRVIQALQWLKQHNPLYRDVSISNISEGMLVDGEEVTEGENS